MDFWDYLRRSFRCTGWSQFFFVFYWTTNSSTGKLIINKLDMNDKIVSGTFYFNAAEVGGKQVEVRHGRFDVFFTQ